MIKELKLYTTSIKQTSEFYTKTLGFKTIVKTNKVVIFKIGVNSLLNFEKTDKDVVVTHFAFNIPRTKLDKYYNYYNDKLKWIQYQKKDIIYFNCWDEKAVYFKDNNGNILEFVTRKGIENIAIGEVGFAINNVTKRAEKAVSILGINFYKEECLTTSFYSLGDHNGLLIFVEKGKKWFPTDIISDTANLKVTFEKDNKQYLLELNKSGLKIINGKTLKAYTL